MKTVAYVYFIKNDRSIKNNDYMNIIYVQDGCFVIYDKEHGQEMLNSDFAFVFNDNDVIQTKDRTGNSVIYLQMVTLEVAKRYLQLPDILVDYLKSLK